MEIRPQVKTAPLHTLPAMNTCKGVAAKVHAFHASVPDENECSASHSGSYSSET